MTIVIWPQTGVGYVRDVDGLLWNGWDTATGFRTVRAAELAIKKTMAFAKRTQKPWTLDEYKVIRVFHRRSKITLDTVSYFCIL